MNNCSHLVDEGHDMMMYVSVGMIFFHLCTYIYQYIYIYIGTTSLYP